MQPLTPDSDFFDEVTGFADDEPLPLPERFARIKRKLIAGHEAAVADSFRRLLGELRAEASRVAAAGSDAVPTIDFLDIDNPARAAAFARDLRRRGVAVIRRVVPPGVAAAWGEETREYIAQSPQRPPPGYPAADPQMFDLYWSPGQVCARADSRMLAAQRFVMRATWHSGSGNGNGDSEALVSTNHPVTYADRFRIRRPGDTSMGVGPHIDGGSVERWESDGYGRGGGGGGGTYGRIFEGRWEDHDPWDADARLAATSDLYNGAGACSMFRMFQGWLALSTAAPGEGSLRVCPMLRLATAYVLLRPFFSPVRPASSFAAARSRPKRKPEPNPNYGTDTDNSGSDSESSSDDDADYESDAAAAGFLRADNWALQARPDSVVQGAVPGRAQELSDAAHPHLRLRRTLVPVPRVEPGDYVVWHPDAVHAADAAHAGPADAAALYVPACPLTATNALYLARQRRAFLLGQPAPDFGGGGGGSSGGGSGAGVGVGGGVESIHLGRPGVQDVNDAGGEEGLRAMGLLAFEDDERGPSSSRVEREVVALANGILFPDRFDICYKRGGAGGQPK